MKAIIPKRTLIRNALRIRSRYHENQPICAFAPPSLSYMQHRLFLAFFRGCLSSMNQGDCIANTIIALYQSSSQGARGLEKRRLDCARGGIKIQLPMIASCAMLCSTRRQPGGSSWNHIVNSPCILSSYSLESPRALRPTGRRSHPLVSGTCAWRD